MHLHVHSLTHTFSTMFRIHRIGRVSILFKQFFSKYFELQHFMSLNVCSHICMRTLFESCKKCVFKYWNIPNWACTKYIYRWHDADKTHHFRNLSFRVFVFVWNLQFPISVHLIRCLLSSFQIQNLGHSRIWLLCYLLGVPIHLEWQQNRNEMTQRQTKIGRITHKSHFNA